MRSRSSDRVRAALLGSATITAGMALVLRDPHGAGSFGICPSVLLGFYCPGCGSLRGTHDLLTGHFTGAVGHNLLLLPVLAWLGWWWVARTARAWGRPVTGPPDSSRFAIGLLVVLAVFVVARNIPGSPLAP